jgi:hypothetical protein
MNSLHSLAGAIRSLLGKPQANANGSYDIYFDPERPPAASPTRRPADYFGSSLTALSFLRLIARLSAS